MIPAERLGKVAAHELDQRALVADVVLREEPGSRLREHRQQQRDHHPAADRIVRGVNFVRRTEDRPDVARRRHRVRARTTRTARFRCRRIPRSRGTARAPAASRRSACARPARRCRRARSRGARPRAARWPSARRAPASPRPARRSAVPRFVRRHRRHGRTGRNGRRCAQAYRVRAGENAGAGPRPRYAKMRMPHRSRAVPRQSVVQGAQRLSDPGNPSPNCPARQGQATPAASAARERTSDRNPTRERTPRTSRRPGRRRPLRRGADRRGAAGPHPVRVARHRRRVCDAGRADFRVLVHAALGVAQDSPAVPAGAAGGHRRRCAGVARAPGRVRTRRRCRRGGGVGVPVGAVAARRRADVAPGPRPRGVRGRDGREHGHAARRRAPGRRGGAGPGSRRRDRGVHLGVDRLPAVRRVRGGVRRRAAARLGRLRPSRGRRPARHAVDRRDGRALCRGRADARGDAVVRRRAAAAGAAGGPPARARRTRRRSCVRWFLSLYALAAASVPIAAAWFAARATVS